MERSIVEDRIYAKNDQQAGYNKQAGWGKMSETNKQSGWGKKFKMGKHARPFDQSLRVEVSQMIYLPVIHSHISLLIKMTHLYFMVK